MKNKALRFFRKLFKNDEGITGLETAIVLIAFVTVASVLAYTVLSAGIFSAEKGKDSVYKGLDTAQSTLEIKGSVLGLSDNKTRLDQVEFSMALAIPNAVVQTNTIVYNFFDNNVHINGLSANTTLSPGSVERGSPGAIEGDEIHVVTINIPASANITAFDTFTIQIVPPAGASISVQRTLPGTLLNVMDLH